MKIGHNHFEHEGEVDCGANHVSGGSQWYRVSIRRVRGTTIKDYLYEVYRRHHNTKEEEVEKTGTLRDCISHVNNFYDYDDEYIEEET